MLLKNILCRNMLKVIIFNLLIFALLQSQTYNSILRPNPWFWLTTYSVGDYQNCVTMSDITDGSFKGEWFKNAMGYEINSKYAATTNFSWEHDIRDANVNFKNFWDNNFTYNDECIFFAGHGGRGTIGFSDCSELWLDYLLAHGNPRPHIFNGYAKWAIFASCLTLNESPYSVYFNTNQKYYQSCFQGIHSMLGFGSIGYSFLPGRCKKYILFWCNQYYLSDADLYSLFAKNWVRDGKIICQAWTNAASDIYYDNGKGIDARVYGVAGQILVNDVITNFYGTDEKFATVLNISTPMGDYQDENSKKSWIPMGGYFSCSTYKVVTGSPLYEIPW